MIDSLQRAWSRLAVVISVTALFAVTANATPGLRGKGYILNNGLWPANVLAVALGSDVDVWVTKTGMLYDHHGMQNGKRVGVVSSATWTDATSDKSTVQIEGSESTVVTFFTNGSVPTNPHAHVVTRLVTGFVLKNVYPGVDVSYKMDEGNARFDIVAQRAELAASVKLSFAGLNLVTQQLVNSDGTANVVDDHAIAVDAEPTDKALSSYVGFKNIKAFQNGQEVAASLALTSNTLSFTGNFAPSQPLVIDPTVYGTYLGGSEDDYLAGLRTLSTGDVVVGGSTSQINFPENLGKYRATGYGTTDGFLAVFDAALTTLKRYSYIGGSDPDSIKAITVSGADNIYAAGTTQSAGFPITGGTAGQVYKAQIDAFAFEMNSALTTLVFSTFIGGNKDDIALDIALDGDLSVYVCGATNSTANFPTNAGFKKTFGGLVDGFLTKLSSSGAAYAYSTYFGTEGVEQFTAVCVEISGAPIVTGFTNSTSFQTFPVPAMMQPQRPYKRQLDGPTDAFATKFGQDGGTLVYSTYIGGLGEEEGKGIFVDELGRSTIVGETTSTNLPATAGFKQNRIGGRDVFLFVLSKDGKEAVGCTYYGGTGDERVRAVTKDKQNAAVVVGTTTSGDLQVEGSGTSSSRKGATDGFVAAMTFGALKYADLVGGNGLDTLVGVFCDVNDDMYVCGHTTSTNLKLSTNAYQATPGGKIDGFVSKSAKGTIELTAPTGGESWCIGSNQTVAWLAADMSTTDKYRIDVTTDNGATWIEVAKDIVARNYSWKPTTLASGDYKLKVTATRGQVTMTTNTLHLGPVAAITTQPTPVAVCQGAKAEFTVAATGDDLKYKWRKDGTIIVGATTATYTIPTVVPANAGSYSVEVTGKCGSAVLSQAVTLKIETNPTITQQPMPQTVEEGKPLTLSVTSSIAGSRFQWSKNGSVIPNATERQYVIPATTLADSGEYSVAVMTDCGNITSSTATIKITPSTSVPEVYLVTGLVRLVGEMPVTQNCSVYIELADYAEVTMRVIDLQGSTTSVPPIRLMHAGGSGKGNGFITDLPCAGLASGSYVLDVSLAGQQAFLPFVVSH